MNDDALKEKALRTRFLTLWKDCLNADVNSDPMKIWVELAHHYSAPGRHYHTLNHLDHSIEQMNLALTCIDEPKAMEMAILFHDVICEPDADDNEQRSADLFEQAARNNFNQEFINQVKKLILSTTHNKNPEFNDEKLICDIDLSSFALPWELFLRDSNAIRAEHPSTPDRLFYPAKLRYLNAMLERPALFLTEFFYVRYENHARENIHRYIKQLRGGSHDSPQP